MPMSSSAQSLSMASQLSPGLCQTEGRRLPSCYLTSWLFLAYMHSCVPADCQWLRALFTGPAGVQSSRRAARRQLQHVQTELCLRRTSGIDAHQCIVRNESGIILVNYLDLA